MVIIKKLWNVTDNLEILWMKDVGILEKLELETKKGGLLNDF